MRNEEFKEAVGKFPTGVTVISTVHDDKLWGFTANSFVSVSLQPSLVSFCLDKKSGSFEAFNAAKHFIVSILASDQADISKHFASKLNNKFSDIDHEISDSSGIPMVSGAVCFIECIKHNYFECGDHMMFIGEAIKTKINSDKPPLVYFAKSYKEIQ